MIPNTSIAVNEITQTVKYFALYTSSTDHCKCEISCFSMEWKEIDTFTCQYCFQICLLTMWFLVGICSRCSLEDYSGMMTKISLLLFSQVVTVFFAFKMLLNWKLERNFFCRSPKFRNTVSVLFVHFTFDIGNFSIGGKCELFTLSV